MGFRYDLAFEPGDAAADQRRGDLRRREGGQVQRRELVRLAAAVAAGRDRGVEQRARRNIDRELARCADQLAREGRFVDHDDDLGRVEIERHAPRRRHHVAARAGCAAHQHGGAVVEQSVSLREGDVLDGHGAGERYCAPRRDQARRRAAASSASRPRPPIIDAQVEGSGTAAAKVRKV